MVSPRAKPDNFDREAFLTRFADGLTKSRLAIARELVKRRWFQATKPELQAELITLPQTGKENHDGYLSDLAARPEHIGGVEVLRLHKLARGTFALISIFDVRNTAQGHEYTYEYVSWRYGPLAGTKGIVFVRPAPDQAPTHFIVLVGEKFAPGRKVYDAIGGFIDLGVEGVQTLTDRILLEVKQEIGVADLNVDEVIDLGEFYPDTGMTNNKPGSFVAFITSDQAGRVPAHHTNEDIYELKSGAVIFPLDQLRQFCQANGDSFFLVALMKAILSDKTTEVFKKAVWRALTS